MVLPMKQVILKMRDTYPLTPTRGCLSSKEIWDSKTGKLVESDQLKLVNAIKRVDRWKGFLVVIELDNKEIPVKY